MSKSVKAAKPILSLKQFILKQEVKTLYRNIFRAIRQVPDKNYQSELKEWARTEFRNNANQQDEISVKMYIQYGQRCLKELRGSIALAK